MAGLSDRLSALQAADREAAAAELTARWSRVPDDAVLRWRAVRREYGPRIEAGDAEAEGAAEAIIRPDAERYGLWNDDGLYDRAIGLNEPGISEAEIEARKRELEQRVLAPRADRLRARIKSFRQEEVLRDG